MRLSELAEYIHRHAHREWAKMTIEHEFSHAEFEYLRAIWAQEIEKTSKDHHGQHLQDVVSEIGVSKASASAMVLKLEERGMVKRVQCQFDARAQHILLTKLGTKRLNLGQEVYEGLALALQSELDRLLQNSNSKAI